MGDTGNVDFYERAAQASPAPSAPDTASTPAATPPAAATSTSEAPSAISFAGLPDAVEPSPDAAATPQPSATATATTPATGGNASRTADARATGQGADPQSAPADGDDLAVYHVVPEGEEVPVEFQSFQFYAKTPEGVTVQYRDTDSLFQGAVEKQAFIHRQAAQIKDLEARVSAASDSEEVRLLRARTEAVEKLLPIESLREAAIKAHLPEKYRDVEDPEAEIEGDEDYRDYLAERKLAERAASAEIQRLEALRSGDASVLGEDPQAAKNREFDARYEAAADRLRPYFENDFFGTRANPELGPVLKEALMEMGGGNPDTVLEYARTVEALLPKETTGIDGVDLVMRGLQSLLQEKRQAAFRPRQVTYRTPRPSIAPPKETPQETGRKMKGDDFYARAQQAG